MTTFRLLLKVAHTVLDQCDGAATYPDVAEAVKARCGQLHLSYSSPPDQIHRVLNCAVYQRLREGKPALLAGSAADIAFALGRKRSRANRGG